MWSALVVYFAVWTLVISAGRPGLVVPAGFLALVYVGFHIFEMTKRHHCYLSADSTALPGACLVAFVMSFVLFDVPRERFMFGGHVVVAVMAWHVAALLYSFALGGLLDWIFRKRIKAEWESGSGLASGE